jgi:hypothetical protein
VVRMVMTGILQGNCDNTKVSKKIHFSYFVIEGPQTQLFDKPCPLIYIQKPCYAERRFTEA